MVQFVLYGVSSRWIKQLKKYPRKRRSATEVVKISVELRRLLDIPPGDMLRWETADWVETALSAFDDSELASIRVIIAARNVE